MNLALAQPRNGRDDASQIPSVQLHPRFTVAAVGHHVSSLHTHSSRDTTHTLWSKMCLLKGDISLDLYITHGTASFRAANSYSYTLNLIRSRVHNFLNTCIRVSISECSPQTVSHQAQLERVPLPSPQTSTLQPRLLDMYLHRHRCGRPYSPQPEFRIYRKPCRARPNVHHGIRYHRLGGCGMAEWADIR